MTTTTPTDGPLPAASLLQLIWLASPALPVGGFSYSEGLESAIEYAGIDSEAAVADWLLDQLHIAQARGDMAVVAQALHAWRSDDHERARAPCRAGTRRSPACSPPPGTPSRGGSPRAGSG